MTEAEEQVHDVLIETVSLSIRGHMPVGHLIRTTKPWDGGVSYQFVNFFGRVLSITNDEAEALMRGENPWAAEGV